MAVECTGRNVAVTPKLREFAEERTQRLERHLGGPAAVRVVLSHAKHRFGAEVIAAHGRRRWKAQEETADPRAALALAFEKIDAQAMRAPARAASAPRRDRGTRIVRGRTSSVKPMGVDEAALAMESSGQEVLVFRDASNERMSVLYRRRDGDFGLIVPEC
jgi:putative sigma-54 modulation protein